MPRHNTPHHTDGPGIGKKLKGQKLNEKLEYLTEKITTHHCKASAAWQGFLHEARDAGEGLIEVKRRLGHRSKWSKWRYQEIIKPGIMSKETSVIYMRIAREWDSPQMQAARAGGIEIDSINKFMEIARCKPKQSQGQAEQVRSMKHDAIRKAFAEKLRELTPYELDLLVDQGALDQLWVGLYEQLRLGVQVCYGDVYEMNAEEEQNKRNVIRKIKQALNNKRSAPSSKANTA